MATRYAYIAQELTRAIANGQWPIGSLLPNELDLAEQFEVSRSTIRAAMRELQISGLISRRKSAGTRVEAVPHARAGTFTQTLDSVEAVQRFGVDTERRLQGVKRVIVDGDLAMTLGVSPGQHWLRISFMRLIPSDAEALPICWTDVYVEDVFGKAMRPRIARHEGIFGTLLEEISGRRIVEIRQQITAVGISARLKTALRCDLGGHALSIRRQYILSPGSTSEVSISIHPAGRYVHSTKLQRGD